MTRTTSSREGLSPQATTSFDLISAQQSDEIDENTSKTLAQSTVQADDGELQIVHATGGRVRIRATDGSHNSVLNTISENLQQQDGVKEVYANQQTGSLVVTFDENQVSTAQILALLQEYNIQPQVSEKTSKTDPLAAWKSLDFWKEQGISFIPLMTGLGVTRGLGIYGLASLPVYLITANATRWVIDYLEPKLSESQKGAIVNHHITNQPPISSVEQTTITKERSTDIDDTASNVAAPTKVAYSVVHTIPFRIRLNVPRLARDRAYARRLERALKTDPEVTSVRMNCDAASVAITYKSSDISVSHWVSLMQLADKIIPETIPLKTTTSEPVTQQVSQPTEPKESTTVTAQPSSREAINCFSTELADIWGDFKPPALSAALNLMANFPLDLVA